MYWKVSLLLLLLLNTEEIDAADSLNIRRISSLVIGNSNLMAIRVLDEICYVAAGDSGIVIVDTRFNRVIRRFHAVAFACDIAIGTDNGADCYVYTAEKEAGLQIFLGLSRNPENLGRKGGFWRWGDGVAINSNETLAFLAGDDLHMLDIRDRENPTQIGILERECNAVTINGNLAYIAANGNLVIADISDPEQPNILCDTLITCSIVDLTYRQGIVFASTGENSVVLVIDVSNPVEPRRLSECRTRGLPINVSTNNGYIAVASQEGGISVFNVINPEEPVEVGYYHYQGQLNASAIDMANGIAYVLNKHTGALERFDCRQALNISHQELPILPTMQVSAFPNPFNSGIQIRFELPVSQMASLALYSAFGQKIADLAKGWYPTGYHTLNLNGGHLPNGVYVIRLSGETYATTTKLLLSK